MKKNTRKIPKPTNFGKNLKFLRKVRGISQQEIAQQVNLNRNNIASYESGTVEPNADAFLRISEFLNVDPFKMLAVEMSNDDLHEFIGVNHADQVMNDYLKNHLSSFIRNTDHTAKIVEAYQNFYELSRQQHISSDWDHLRDQVIELMQDLLDNNWDFLQRMNISEEE